MDFKTEFCKIVNEKIHREGINNLMDYLNKSDFFTAPASTRFHGSYPGGLCEHSINVYNELRRLLTVYPEVEVSDESVAIAALFHDLCKANVYKSEKRNRKNANGQWEQYDAYTFDEKFHYGGHGSKSVFLCERYMKLTIEEAVAINCHMGTSDGNMSVCDAYGQFGLAWLLHVADESATYMIESKKD